MRGNQGKARAKNPVTKIVSFSPPIQIFPVETEEVSCRAAFNMSEHSKGCILWAAPFFGKCMTCTCAAATKEIELSSPHYSPTNIWDPTSFAHMCQKQSTTAEEQQYFELCLIDLVGSTALASPVSIEGISVFNLVSSSPIFPCPGTPLTPASPQWNPETMSSMADPVHMIPLSLANGRSVQTTYSTNFTSSPVVLMITLVNKL